MGGLGEPASAATVINNIFRNYGHQHIYDFDEFVRAATLADFAVSDAVCTMRQA